VGFFVGIVVCLCLLVVAVLRMSAPHDYLSRYSVVVDASPVEVWSLDPVAGTMVVLTIPSDTTIETLYGYGMYTLDALWKLGNIENKAGTIVADSLSDALGLSIPWYIAPSSQDIQWTSTDNNYGSSLFSYANVTKKLFGQYRTNMPFGVWMAFVNAVSGARVEQKHVLSFGHDQIAYQEDLPDGSTRFVLDRTRIDYYLNSVFTSEAFRKENVSVTLFNTSDVPLIGNRAARFLANEGIMVASIGNDPVQTKTCVMRGQTAALASKTAIEVARLFRCTREKISAEDRSDLMVYLGTDFAEKYRTTQ